MLGQVKGNNCKVQLQLVVAGPVLLPTPGQGEMRDEEFWGKLGSSCHLVVLLWLWFSSLLCELKNSVSCEQAQGSS